MSIYKSVLDILSRHPDGVPQSFLYRALPVSKSYISIVLRELEERGVVYRIRIGNTYIVRLAKPFSNRFHGKKLVIGVVWSSEYLFLGHFAKLLRNVLSMDLDVKVYPNAVSATVSLALGEVDAVLSPLITQLYLYPILKSFKIVGGGASGGGFIYEVSSGVGDAVASSEMSTMDLCRAVATEKKVIDTRNVVYFSNPQQPIEIVKKKSAKYIVAWHPITHEIEKLSTKMIADCFEFEEIKHCCTLAISNSIPLETIDKIANIYRKAINDFRKEPEKFLDWYSTTTGIEISLLKKALSIYQYNEYIDRKNIDKLLQFINIKIPHISKLEEVFVQI